jgi:hypothetical protein
VSTRREEPTVHRLRHSKSNMPSGMADLRRSFGMTCCPGCISDLLQMSTRWYFVPGIR